jgi:hypothetical protein
LFQTNAPIAAAKRRLPPTLDGVVASLNSKDDWLRVVAMQRIQEMGDAALMAIPTLVNRFEQGDQQAEQTLATVCKAAGDGAGPANKRADALLPAGTSRARRRRKAQYSRLPADTIALAPQVCSLTHDGHFRH